MREEPTQDEFRMRELLDEAALPDDGFSTKVLARVQRYRRTRRLVFLTATLVSLGLCWALMPSGMTAAPTLDLEAWHLFATVIMIGALALFWTDTETLTLPRPWSWGRTERSWPSTNTASSWKRP